MGVIIRQSLKSTLVNFLGAAIGVYSVLFIYPSYKEMSGLAQYIYAQANLLLPILTLGIPTIVIKYYHSFNTAHAQKSMGLMGFVIINLLVTMGLGLAIFYGIKVGVERSAMGAEGINAKELFDNFWPIMGVSICLSFIASFNYFANVYGRIAIPNLLQNLGYKVFLPLLLLLIGHAYLAPQWLGIGLVVYFVVIAVVLFGYVRQLMGQDFSIKPYVPSKPALKGMYQYAFFSLLSLIGSLLVYRIDQVMITTMIGYVANNAYSMVLIMASVMDYPTQAITAISAPIVSKAMVEKNHAEVTNIYTKAATNLLIIGFLIFLGGYFCMDDLTSISSDPSAFVQARTIFVVLALTKLIDMATSVNTSILAYSQFYRYNVVFILILGVLNIVFNYFFITVYGIVGAAIATLISMTIYNLVKLVFIYRHFGYQPFSMAIVKLLGIVGLVFVVFSVVPSFANPWLSLISKTAGISLIYGIMVYKFNISEDVNRLIHKWLPFLR